MIQIKRTYDPPARGDGRRILVERLWPRGMKKETVAADAWLKEVAPSTELRKQFGHRPERWEEFRRQYVDELDANPSGWEPLLEASRIGPITLLYSAHDSQHNGALVLRDFLLERVSDTAGRRRVGQAKGASTPRKHRMARGHPRSRASSRRGRTARRSGE